MRKKFIIIIILILLIPTSLLLFQEKEEVIEDLQHRRFKDLNIVSAKKPYHTAVFIEASDGDLYLVDSVDKTKLYKSIDKGDNWSLITTRTYTIQNAWYDRSTEYIYFHCTTNSNINHKCFYIDLSDDSITEMGSFTTAAQQFKFGFDIFKIGTDFYTTATAIVGADHDLQIRKWVDPNWVLTASYDDGEAYAPRSNLITVVGTDAYFVLQNTNTNFDTHFMKFDSTIPSIVSLWESAAYSYGSMNQWAIAYDGNDVLSFVLEKDADGKFYLQKWSIVGAAITEIAEYNIALMADRNNIGIAPNEFEKAFSIDAVETVYEITAKRGGVRVLQNMSAITDAVIIAITDNFLMNDDGDMFEFTDVTSEISSINYNDGIMGILKKGEFTVHPDFHVNWSKGDSIKIYDDIPILEFHGLITDKNRNSRGIYVFKIDSFTNEIYRKTYEKSYSGDDTDTKQKDVIDNACDFCYRSSSIVGTTTNYDYEYNRAIIYLFWLARFLERQVPYIEPDGKIWTKVYNGLTATGKSWDIIDKNQEVFLIDIPGIEEIIQGFFDGNTGITRNTIRYKNNATATRPVAATRDPIEQLQGILPLNEFRDPKLEAATEANQLGDNRYNIFSTDTIFLGLRIEGQGYLQPGKTIEIQNTGQITIVQDDFLILWFERDPKNDVYTSMILSDNIIFPNEFTKLQDTTITQVHTASVQAIENQAAITASGINDLQLVGVRLADGTTINTWTSTAIYVMPAADQNAEIGYVGHAPAGMAPMTNPTLSLMFSGPAGDTWTISLRVHAAGHAEDQGNNLYNASVNITAAAGVKFYRKDVTLTGTISALDEIGVRLEKTSNDAQDLYMHPVCWITRV